MGTGLFLTPTAARLVPSSLRVRDVKIAKGRGQPPGTWQRPEALVVKMLPTCARRGRVRKSGATATSVRQPIRAHTGRRKIMPRAEAAGTTPGWPRLEKAAEMVSYGHCNR